MRGQYHQFAKVAEFIGTMNYLVTVRDILMEYDNTKDQLNILGTFILFTGIQEEEKQ